MNTYPTTPDLLNTLRSLKKEEQIDLMEYINRRYKSSSDISDHYRKNALSQIRMALK